MTEQTQQKKTMDDLQKDFDQACYRLGYALVVKADQDSIINQNMALVMELKKQAEVLKQFETSKEETK